MKENQEQKKKETEKEKQKVEKPESEKEIEKEKEKKAKLKELLEKEKEKAETAGLEEPEEREAQAKPRLEIEEARKAVAPILKPIEHTRRLEEELADVIVPVKAEKEKKERKYWEKPSGYRKGSETVSDYVTREEDERKYVEGLELKDIPPSERVKDLIPRREFSREIPRPEEAVEKRILKYEPKRSESDVGPIARQKEKEIKKYKRH